MLKVAMTRPPYNDKVAELARQGLTLTGDHGEVDEEGVTVAYTYDGDTLTLQVMRKALPGVNGVLRREAR